MTLRPVTTEGMLLLKISDQLGELLDILRPQQQPTPVEEEPRKVEVRGSADTEPAEDQVEVSEPAELAEKPTRKRPARRSSRK